MENNLSDDADVAGIARYCLASWDRLGSDSSWSFPYNNGLSLRYADWNHSYSSTSSPTVGSSCSLDPSNSSRNYMHTFFKDSSSLHSCNEKDSSGADCLIFASSSRTTSLIKSLTSSPTKLNFLKQGCRYDAIIGILMLPRNSV